MITNPVKRTLKLLAVLLFILTSYRIIFYLSNVHDPQENVLSAFLLGLRFDLRWAAIPSLIFLWLTSFRFFSPQHSRKALLGWTILFTIIALIYAFVLCLDFYYFDYLRQRLNMYLVTLMKDPREALGMAWQSYPILWLFLGIVLFGTIFYYIFYRILSQNYLQTSFYKRTRIINTLVLSLLLGLGIFGEIGQYPLRWSKAYDGQSLMMGHVTLNPFETLLNSMKNKGSAYDEKWVKSGYNWLSDYFYIESKDSTRLQYERFVDSNPNKPVKNLNVVLIIAESFAAHLNSSFKTPIKTMPFFDALVPNGVLFERCFTHGGGTAKGVFSTLTGIPDFEEIGTASRNPQLIAQHIIFDELEGYNKYYFIGGSLSWANVRGFLNANIEDLKTYEELDYNSARSDIWGVADKALLLEVNEILGHEEKPFFATIQLASNHKPYTIPEEDIGKDFQLIQMDKDTIAKYGFNDIKQFNALRYMDYSLGCFIDAAKKQAYFDNTLFVIVGDHGPKTSSIPFFPRAWERNGFDMRQTPLFFYSPKHITPKRITSLAAQIDVGPTIMGILNKSYHYKGMGRDLLDPNLSKPAVYYYVNNEYNMLMDSCIITISSVKGQDRFDDYSQPPLSSSRGEFLKDSLRIPILEYFHTARYLMRHNVTSVDGKK